MLEWVLLIVGVVLLIAALYIAFILKSEDLTDKNLTVNGAITFAIMIVLFMIGAILIGGSSYAYNTGSPVYVLDTFAGIPEGQIFVVDRIVADGDEGVLWLVVPYLRQDATPTYVEVCKKDLLDDVVVGDKIIRDGVYIKKVV